MADLDFDLEEFEAELASGKYNHLLQKEKVKTQEKKKAEVRALNKMSGARVVQPVPEPEIVAVVYRYRVSVCDTCGQQVEILSQRLIKGRVRNINMYYPEAMGSDIDKLIASGTRVIKQVVKEPVVACSLCCDHQLFESLPEE